MNEPTITILLIPVFFIAGSVFNLKRTNPHLSVTDCINLTLSMILSMFKKP